MDEFFGGAFAIVSSHSVLFSMNNQVYEITFGGGTSVYIDHTFERIVILYADDENNLWMTDKGYKNGTLYRYSQGELTIHANGLLPENPVHPVFEEERHQWLYGIAREPRGHVYVAENAGRKIIGVGEAGGSFTFYESDPP